MTVGICQVKFCDAITPSGEPRSPLGDDWRSWDGRGDDQLQVIGNLLKRSATTEILAQGGGSTVVHL
jgi:hypothetical protein